MAGYVGPEPIQFAPDSFGCGEPGCEARFPTAIGTKAHWSRIHKPKEEISEDELFERSGAALQAMYPEVTNFPWARTAELGKLQTDIMKVLAR